MGDELAVFLVGSTGRQFLLDHLAQVRTLLHPGNDLSRDWSLAVVAEKVLFEQFRQFQWLFRVFASPPNLG